MNLIKRFAAVGSIGVGVMLYSAVAAPLPAPSAFQNGYGDQGYGQRGYGEHRNLRDLVDQTQSDLHAAADTEHNDSKARDRYKNAQKSLSTFDRHLTKGKYDKDELDKAIGDIQSVLDHNTLQGSARDALMRDVSDLRVARARRSK